MNYYGILIHRERLQRNWSQEGLCKGICAVSYLSKIEQGKALPSEEVLQLLLKRLDISVDAETEDEARVVVDKAYEVLFSGEFHEFHNVMTGAESEKYRFTTVGLDFMLLEQLAGQRNSSNQALEKKHNILENESFEDGMNVRQLTLQRIYQKRFEDAVRLLPNAYTYYLAGAEAYEQGENYSVALEYLQASYDMAAKEGAPRLMLLAKLLIGNCYCNQVDLENMSVHYQVAERLAKSLRDTEALDALSQAEQMEVEYPAKELVWSMCEIVRFRLMHEDYLESEEYGHFLLDCFEELRKKLPIGYAAFHLPWVLEWYTANRQYKKAYDLVTGFPIKYNLR